MFDDDDWLGGEHQPSYIPILILLLFAAWGIVYAQECNTIISSTERYPCSIGGCGEVVGTYQYPWYITKSETVEIWRCSGTTETGSGAYYSCKIYGCRDNCASKKQICENEGGTWQPSLNPNECGECKSCANDTLWYSDSSCTGPNGAGMYIQSVVKHQIKDCQETTIEMTWQTSSCEKDTTYKCLGTVNGHTVMMRAPSGATFNCEADGSCQFAMNKIASGECGPSLGPNPNSSNSNNSSSSEEQSSSSSEEQSSSSEDEEPNSSETQQQNSSNSVSVAELPQRLYDSLGAIDASIQWYQPLVNGIYDGVYDISGTAHDMNVNLININESTAGINDKMGTANDYLRQIANKDFSPDIHVGAPDVNIDVSGIQSNQDETRDSLHNTNSLLEDIKGLLGSSGSDTIRIDTSKAPASIDSALKHWGNRSNHTFAAAGLDSSGWGHTNDSAGAATDSVLSRADFFGSLGCDTTGGKKCDGSIIGADGLETATGSMKATYGDLRDSLMNGAFADSLRLWGNKFTGNGTLTGGGSNSCPSVLTKTYRVDIYKGAGYDFTLGRYLCAPLFGQTTAWSLCRMLLRATIAFACMWFLFKCATGFGGGGDD